MARNLTGQQLDGYVRLLRARSRCLTSGSEKSIYKNGWREFGGRRRIYFRSQWEANYGRYLQWLKDRKEIADWEFENKTFWFPIKRGCVSYLPDFKVINNDGSHHWVEVKGYWDKKSVTKVKRFNKYFPEEKLIIIDKIWYSKVGRKLSGLIPGWEGHSARKFFLIKK